MTASRAISRTPPEVVVVGAGPVGLLLGCLLGKQGIHTLVLERQAETAVQSQAIGITPPSLEILNCLQLAELCIGAGIPIHDCHVHGQTGYLGCASFRQLPPPFSFVLSLPQQMMMAALRDKLASYACVTVQTGVEVTTLTQHDSHVEVLAQKDGHTLVIRSEYAAACDGSHSRLRDLLRVGTKTHRYGCHFVMGDFHDRSPLGEEAHLFFTAAGAVESFPLPSGRRRWIVQAHRPHTDAHPTSITGAVHERSGIPIEPRDQINESAFSPWRLDCDQLYQGRVLLCGDAAHVMSPIGGQGMNTGFADAEFAAAMLFAVLRGNQAAAPWLAMYDRCRRVAAGVAADRAAKGMWLGTWQGMSAALLRDFILRFLVFQGPLARHLGPWFGMLTIPYNRLSQSPWAAARLREVRAPAPSNAHETSLRPAGTAGDLTRRPS